MIMINDRVYKGLVLWPADGVLSRLCRCAGHEFEFRLNQGPFLRAGRFSLEVIVAAGGI